MKWLFGLLRWNNTLQLKRAKACRSKISNAAKVKTVNNGSLERTYCSEVNGDRKGSIAVSCKEAVQERRAAEKKERNRLHCQQNQEKIIERREDEKSVNPQLNVLNTQGVLSKRSWKRKQ